MLKINEKKVLDDTKICKNVFDKALGLMFSKRKDKALIFVFKRPIKISLHMFFVFYNIDLIFLNEEKKVIEIKRNLRPFTFYTSKEKAKYVIETPITLDINLNDRVSFN